MAPGACQPIMDQLLHRATCRACRPLGGGLNLERNRAFAGFEVDADRAPRRATPESLSKEGFHPR